MKNDSLNTIGKRIKFALANHPSGKKSQEWLKNEMHVSQAAISQWSNDVQVPKNTVLLAEKLGVNLAWLGKGDGDAFAPQHMIKNQSEYSLQSQVAGAIARVPHDLGTIPVLGHANGSKEAIMLNFDDPIGEVTAHPNQTGMKGAFALYARGDSMGHRYKDGELIYVIANKPPSRGQDCIIELKNGESYLKEFDRRTDKEIICKQYKPEIFWKRKIEEIKSLHAVVGRG